MIFQELYALFLLYNSVLSAFMAFHLLSEQASLILRIMSKDCFFVLVMGK